MKSAKFALFYFVTFGKFTASDNLDLLGQVNFKAYQIVFVRLALTLPGQVLILHSAVSSESPSHPPISSTGPLLHALFRILDPGPHVVEQSLKTPQLLQAKNGRLKMF